MPDFLAEVAKHHRRALADMIDDTHRALRDRCGITSVADPKYGAASNDCKVLAEVDWILVQIHDSGGEPIFKQGIIANVVTRLQVSDIPPRPKSLQRETFD